MRDIIWTIIAIWIVYKVYETIKSATTSKASSSFNQNQTNKNGKVTVQTNIDNQSKYNVKDAEYVDYEEVN